VGGRWTRREQIVQAARAAIEEHGPEALTGQIANVAGLARPNVYRHFPSKDALDFAVAHSVYREMAAVIQDQLRSSGTVMDCIRAPINAQVRWAQAHPNLYRFLVSRDFHRYLVSGDDGGRDALRRPVGTAFSIELAAAGEQYLSRFAQDPDAAEAIVIELAGLVDVSILRWLSWGSETSDQLVERLTADVWLIFDSYLRRRGVSLDPQLPLPPAD
jgi:AcrR family transcriptional regulator